MLESFSLLNTFPAQPQTHCLSKGRTLVTATPQEPAGLRTSALEPGLGQRGGEKGEGQGENGGKEEGRAGVTEKVREGQERRREIWGRWKVRKREDESPEYVCGRGRKRMRGLEGVESVALPQGSVCKPLSTPQSCFHREIYKTGLRFSLLPCIMSE